MQTNNSFIKIIRQRDGEQMNKPKSKANKPERIISKRDWQ